MATPAPRDPHRDIVLGLERGFNANMTGNDVFLGFALAGVLDSRSPVRSCPPCTRHHGSLSAIRGEVGYGTGKIPEDTIAPPPTRYPLAPRWSELLSTGWLRPEEAAGGEAPAAFPHGETASVTALCSETMARATGAGILRRLAAGHGSWRARDSSSAGG